MIHEKNRKIYEKSSVCNKAVREGKLLNHAVLNYNNKHLEEQEQNAKNKYVFVGI